MTEDEMVGWHHRFNGHEFEQTPGDGEGQGSLECCIHGVAKSEEQLNNRNLTWSRASVAAAQLFSCDRLFAILRTVACQAPLYMGS